jgi:mono/diheme cytochrome c family protein
MHYISRLIVSLLVLLTCPLSAGTIPAPTTQPSPAPPLKGMDISGTVHPLADDPEVNATALVFLSTQCPISNKYVPELNRLAAAARASTDATHFFAVISDPSVTRAAAARYVAEYQITFPVLFDASGELAHRLNPKMTPEAFVLDRHGDVKYRGRIDDLWLDLRKQKNAATTHDLADALAAVAAGRAPQVDHTQPIGCFFESWEAAAANATPTKVTYTRDIAPILNSNCVQCHHTGEVAPFPLTSYEDAAKHAKQMARVTDDRLMPPWKAEPGFGHFVDERRLSDREIALLVSWSKSGTPQGDPADLPPPPAFTGDWALGKPDLVLTFPKPFNVPAAGRDAYRVFDIPVDLPEDKYVIGFEFKPGAATVVHHALFFLDSTGQARELSAKSDDGEPGYPVFGGVGFRPSGGLGGWAPGVSPHFFPDGVGRPLRRGSDIVLQVHYHPDGKPHADASRLALYFAKKPVQKIALDFPLANRKIDIPPGDPHYVRTATMTVPADVTLIGIIPHMHLLGRQMKAVATTPDGSEIPLIYVKDWDFRWQDQYHYVDPIHLPAGTRIDMEAIYDNSPANPDNPSNPPIRVVRGEQTTNEMCICFLQYTVDGWNAGEGKVGLLRTMLNRAARRGANPASNEK